MSAMAQDSDSEKVASEPAPVEQVEESPLEDLQPWQSNSSSRSGAFEPLHTEDVAVLKRLASDFSRTQSHLQRTATTSSTIKRERTIGTSITSNGQLNPCRSG